MSQMTNLFHFLKKEWRRLGFFGSFATLIAILAFFGINTPFQYPVQNNEKLVTQVDIQRALLKGNVDLNDVLAVPDLAAKLGIAGQTSDDWRDFSQAHDEIRKNGSKEQKEALDLLLAGDTPSASLAYEHGIPPSKSDQYEYLLDKVKLFRHVDFGIAFSAAERAYSIDNGDPDLLLVYGELLEVAGKREAAAEKFSAALNSPISENIQKGDAAIFLAELNSKEGNLESAVQKIEIGLTYYRKAEASSKQAYAYVALSKIWGARDHYDEAIKALETGFELCQPSDRFCQATVIIQRGLTETSFKGPETGRQYYERARGLIGEQGDINIVVKIKILEAQIYTMAGEFDKARQALAHAEKYIGRMRSGDIKWQYHLQKGEIELLANNTMIASGHFRRGIAEALEAGDIVAEARLRSRFALTLIATNEKLRARDELWIAIDLFDQAKLLETSEGRWAASTYRNL
jgi:tetratricopeptide (TPR) repeat protein